MTDIIVATKNLNKLKEIKEIFDNKNIKLLSLDDLSFDDEIIEDGKTFEENAYIKASFIAKKYNKMTIADDSGLCVYALNLEPGIYSARYNADNLFKDNIEKLLYNMRNIKERRAYFYAAMCLYIPNNSDDDLVLYSNGIVNGIITYEKTGDNGFGYDPIFYLEEYKKTMAEIDENLKNKISHRAMAIRKLEEKINENLINF